MPSKNQYTQFIKLLHNKIDQGGFDNDELIQATLPLFKITQKVHKEFFKVAPLEGLGDITVSDGPHLSFNLNDILNVRRNESVLKDISKGDRVVIKHFTEANTVVEISQKEKELRDLNIQYDQSQEIQRPVYLLNYLSYEHLIKHHDELTDIFSLGLILASLAFGLDFRNLDDLKIFVSNRKNLFILNLDVHPVIAEIIESMTELDRTKRAQSLERIIEQLEDYNNYSPPEEAELPVSQSIPKSSNANEKKIIEFRDRILSQSQKSSLFNMDKEENGHLNIIDHIKDVKYYQEENNKQLKILLNDDNLLKKFIRGRQINITKDLSLKENPELEEQLENYRVRAEDKKKQEGVQMTYVVLSMLYWNYEELNTDEQKKQRIVTSKAPLVLLPISMYRKTADGSLVIRSLSYEAEINPVLRYYFKNYFAIDLPVKINLEDISIEDFYHNLKNQFLSRNSVVNLNYISPEKARRQLKKGGKSVGADSGRDWNYDSSSLFIGLFDTHHYLAINDYDYILDRDAGLNSFNYIFLNQKNEISMKDVDLPEIDFSLYPVDAYQKKIIAAANSGTNFLVESPYRTNRYHTMANVVVNAAVEGQQVLFVSHSKNSIERFFGYLKRKNLNHLIAMVHEPYQDRKIFLQNLQSTYEEFMRPKDDFEILSKTKNDYKKELQKDQSFVENYISSLKKSSQTSNISVYKLLERLVELKRSTIEVKKAHFEMIPSYDLWIKHGSAISEISRKLRSVRLSSSLAKTSFRHIKERVLILNTSKNEIEKSLNHLKKNFEKVLDIFTHIEIDSQYWRNFNRIKKIVRKAYSVKDLAKKNILYLLNKKHPKTVAYARLVNKYNRRKLELEEAYENNAGWKRKLPERDLKSALDRLASFDNTPFSFMSPAFRSFRKIIEDHYDFNRHADKPSLFQVLSSLKNEYELVRKQNELTKELKYNYGIDDIDKVDVIIRELRMEMREAQDVERNYLLKHRNNKEVILLLSQAQDYIIQIQNVLRDLIEDYETRSLVEIIEICRDFGNDLKHLENLKPSFQKFVKLPEAIKVFLRTVPVDDKETEYLMVKKSIVEHFKNEDQIYRARGKTIIKKIDRINDLDKHIREIDQKLVFAINKRKFKAKMNVTMKSYTQLDEKRKMFKKVYSTGRRILENEFHRSIRCKSLPELIERESGMVINDLKPIWLMHYSHVSNSIPIDTMNFDLLIIDEADKIPSEMIAPALFRAKQVIVFGRNKIISKEKDDKKDLVRKSANLPTYDLYYPERPMNEILFSFRNSTFYRNQLVDTPSPSLHRSKLTRIIANKKGQTLDLSRIFRNPVSHHLIQNGYYEDNKNELEATYIAKILKKLLDVKKELPTLGIVTLTKEQAVEIEKKIEIEILKDKVLSKTFSRLKNKYELDTFSGIYVKSIDEIKEEPRDLIILSVGYGFNLDGEMNYDFGSIGSDAGLNNLDLLLSLPNDNLAVVSSIEYDDIDNVYSDGVKYFKMFLQYAEAVSIQNTLEADSILYKKQVEQGINTERYNAPDSIMKQVASEIESLGYKCDYNVGLEYFKVDIGVYDTRIDKTYKLGILVDSNDYKKYSQNNEFVRYSNLKRSGWNIYQVFIKDWYQDSEKVIEEIKEKLGYEESENKYDLISEVESQQPQQLESKFKKFRIDINQEEEKEVATASSSIQVHKISFGQGA